MSSKKILVSVLSALTLTACGSDDFYSRVHDVCNFPVTNLGKTFDPLTDVETYLTPGCKSALESVIPYDSDSWASAPAGMRNRVSEAFQVLLAYPLVIPVENKLFGISNEIAGAIPGDLIDVFRRESNPNQSVFNYILSKTDSVHYDGVVIHTNDAKYTLEPNLKPRQITIYDTFWNPDKTSQAKRQPFTSAALLIHEAYHGSGQPHVFCETETRDGFNCDETLKGPYGIDVAYLHFLLNGSGVCTGAGCEPMLDLWSVHMAGLEICSIVLNRINHPNADLAALFKSKQGTTKDGKPEPCDFVSPDWTMDQEGLPEIPKSP